MSLLVRPAPITSSPGYVCTQVITQHNQIYFRSFDLHGDKGHGGCVVDPLVESMISA